MRAVLLHNPSAGSGSPTAEVLVAALRDSGLHVSYGSVKDQTADLLDRPADLVIAAGGDGTVARVLCALADRQVPVAILPLGTANNIARSLGIADQPEAFTAGWRDAVPRRLDIGVATGPWGRRRFIEAVGLGSLVRSILRSEAVEDKSQRLQRGRRAFCEALAENPPEPLEVRIDGQPLPGDLLLVEIMNIGYGGPGLRLAPSADPGDGLLDVVAIEADRRHDMLAWLDQPETSAPPPAIVRRGRQIVINWAGIPLRLDDDCPEPPAEAAVVMVELEREPVTVLVPAPPAAGD